MAKLKIAVIVLFCVFLCSPMPAYGMTYAADQSLVAENQAKASRGISIPGLDITWLDFGDDVILVYSEMTEYAEGVFSLRMSSGTVIFDKTGKVIMSGDYDNVSPFSDGMALVQKTRPLENWKPGELSAPPGYFSGYIGIDGKEVIPLGKLNDISSDFHEGLAVIGNYGQIKGYINKTGDIVIPQIYSDAGDFSEGLAPVQSSETKFWGYIDNSGNQVIPFEYEDARPFSEGLAYVVKNGEGGYIDKTGTVMIDFQFMADENVDGYDYNDIDRSFYNGLAAARDKTGHYGYIDKTGTFAIPAKFSEADPFKGNVAFVNSKYLINRKGERITPLNYYSHYDGESMQAGLIRMLYPAGALSTQYVAMLNQYGAEVVPSSLHIEHMSSFNEGYALLFAFDDNGSQAVGLVKIPENTDDLKSGKLIKAVIDGELLEFEDADPVIENARVLVPMRAIFESLGASVEWDPESQTASGTKDGVTISMKIGDKTGYVDGKAVDLDAAAMIQNGRTMVPVRFVAESLNAEVSWNVADRTVYINTK